MSDFSALPFGLVRQPDRRQIPDRRKARKGGRRASDESRSAVSFTVEPDRELAQVLAMWGPLLRLSRASAGPASAR